LGVPVLNKTEDRYDEKYSESGAVSRVKITKG